jgi:hypothetical protein
MTANAPGTPDWAISLIGANPPTGQSKKGADRGIDGFILFYDRVEIRKPQLRKILVQVKGGATGRGDIAKLKGDMDREGAPMGVLMQTASRHCGSSSFLVSQAP